MFIRVNVTDQDSEEATDLVDAFHFKYSRTAFFNSSLAEYMDYFIRGERKNNPTRLVVNTSTSSLNETPCFAQVNVYISKNLFLIHRKF